MKRCDEGGARYVEVSDVHGDDVGIKNKHELNQLLDGKTCFLASPVNVNNLNVLFLVH